MPFDLAYSYTKGFEGGYVNDPVDPGGETFRGISRRANPDWPGWPLVDKAKSVSPKASAIDAYFKGDEAMAELVRERYEKNYWDPLGELPDLVKMKLFDVSVNFGQSVAVKLLQTALVSLGANLVIDGKLGPATRGAAESFDPAKAVEALCKKQAARYRAIAASKPTQKKFLNGWLKRAEWRP